MRSTADGLHNSWPNVFADLTPVNIRIIKYGLETGLLMLAPLLKSPETKIRIASLFALGLLDPRVAEAARMTTEDSAKDANDMIFSGYAKLQASTRDIARLVLVREGIPLPPQPVDVLRRGPRAR